MVSRAFEGAALDRQRLQASALVAHGPASTPKPTRATRRRVFRCEGGLGTPPVHDPPEDTEGFKLESRVKTDRAGSRASPAPGLRKASLDQVLQYFRPQSPQLARPQSRRIREACGHMRRPWKREGPSTFPARRNASSPKNYWVVSFFGTYPNSPIRKFVRITLQPQNIATGTTWTPADRLSTKNGLPSDPKSSSGAPKMCSVDLRGRFCDPLGEPFGPRHVHITRSPILTS